MKISHFRTVSVFCLLLLPLLLGGCGTIVFNSAGTDKPITFFERPGPKQHFRDETKAFLFLGGLFTILQPEVAAIVVDSGSSRRGVTNLRMETRYTFGDILLTVLTLNIVHVRTVVIEGDAIVEPPGVERILRIPPEVDDFSSSTSGEEPAPTSISGQS